MLELKPTQLAQLTGEDLLRQVQQQGARQRGDLLLGGHVWRVYRSTLRRRGTFVNLWCKKVWVRGRPEQCIAEMRQVDKDNR